MQPSPETVWHANNQELAEILKTDAFAPKPKIVRFYAPSFMYYKTSYYSSLPIRFPTVSVTGTACALNCKHCGGKVLETMRSATTPKALLALAAKLKENGALGCLVSGGCLSDGSVPLKQFITTIGKIKKELGLTVFVHTGIVDFSTAIALRNARADAALIDVIGSDETIKKTCSLKVTVLDYAKSLNAMKDAGLTVVPHVIVGLDEGNLEGELNALRLIASVKPAALVIIAFMPIPGTAMAKVNPPQPADIARVTAAARLMFPKTPLVLGCVRPKGKHRAETDVLALKAGVDAIAFPSEEAIEYAKEQSYRFSFSPYCCAQICMDVGFRSGLQTNS